VLAGRSSHGAAKAAEIVGESEIGELVSDLTAAFIRFMDKPVKSDPGCTAKTAITNALYRIAAPEIDVFLQGIRHVQLEPAWGPPVDTAIDLRATSALALIRVGYSDYLAEIADLLADREPAARRAAAQALAYSENPAAVPLLRLRALMRDDDPQVVSECLLAILKITGKASIDFVARFFNDPSEAMHEAAALALGSSRLREAFPILKEWTEGPISSSLVRTGLLAIALLKHEEAIDYLLGLVAKASPLQAREAIRALAVYRHDDKLREQAEAVLKRREDRSVTALFKEMFDSR
jgi:HEAT repeat protein